MKWSVRGPLPAHRRSASEAAHPVPRPRGSPLLRGADGGGGLLLRLLAALSPRRPVGDRRRRGLGAARPDPHAQPPAQSRGTSSCTTSRPGRTRSTTGAWCSATTTCGSRTSSPAPTPRRTTATRSATSACTSSPAPASSRRSSGSIGYRAGDYVRRPAGDHAPLGAGRAEPAVRDRGEQPYRAAEALPLPLRAAARARAVLRARPVRPDAALHRGGHRRRRAGQAPHQRRASSAPG